MKSYRVVVCLSLLFAALPARAEVALSAAGVQNRLMVLFKPGVTESQQRKLVESHGLEVLRVFKPSPTLSIHSKSSATDSLSG